MSRRITKSTEKIRRQGVVVDTKNDLRECWTLPRRAGDKVGTSDRLETNLNLGKVYIRCRFYDGAPR